MHVRLENTMPIKKTEGGGRCQGRSGGSEACKLDVCTGQRSRECNKEYSNWYLVKHGIVGENYMPF